MKKISTVATQQSRKMSEQELTIGLDLGAIARAGVACWMKQARLSGSRNWARHRKP